MNYGVGASNFASGYGSGYQGYNQPQGSYPYRGGYPTSYAYHRQYNTPVNTYPLGGIGTVGPYGGNKFGKQLQRNDKSHIIILFQERTADLMDTLAVLTVLEAMVSWAVTRSSRISSLISSNISNTSKVATSRRVDVG